MQITFTSRLWKPICKVLRVTQVKIVQLYQFMIYHLFAWTSTVHTSFCVLKLAYHFDDIFFSVCTFLFFIFLFVLLILPVFIHRQLTDCCRTYLHCGTGETTRISCGVNGMARRKKQHSLQNECIQNKCLYCAVHPILCGCCSDFYSKIRRNKG